MLAGAESAVRSLQSAVPQSAVCNLPIMPTADLHRLDEPEGLEAQAQAFAVLC